MAASSLLSVPVSAPARLIIMPCFKLPSGEQLEYIVDCDERGCDAVKTLADVCTGRLLAAFGDTAVFESVPGHGLFILNSVTGTCTETSATTYEDMLAAVDDFVTQAMTFRAGISVTGPRVADLPPPTHARTKTWVLPELNLCLQHASDNMYELYVLADC